MTDSKIIEAVARALCTANGMAVEAPVSEGPLRGQSQWRTFEDEARAAIEAYEAAIAEKGLVIVPREPTEEMIAAAPKRG